MVRLADLTEVEADALRSMPAEPFPEQPFVTGPALDKRRVAVVTTAGLHHRDQASFAIGDAGYRVIASDTPAQDLIMSQASVTFDRTGYQQDLNVVFPIDRLREMAAAGEIGSLAANHYSMMAAFMDFAAAESSVRDIAGHLKNDGVDAVVLSPV